LVELWWLLTSHRPAVRQTRCFDRLRALVVRQVCSAARRTLKPVLLTLGLVASDWNTFYRLFSVPRLDFGVLTRCFLHQTLAQIPADAPYVAVVDGVHLPRASQRMPGMSWLKCPRTPPFKPGIRCARRCVHLAALPPRWQGYSRALPVRCVPAFPPTAVPGAATLHSEWDAARAELCWLRTQLDTSGRPRWGGAPRWSLRTLWRGYRQALGSCRNFHPARAGTHSTWAEQEAWQHYLDAALAATLPV
jgi:hypothetical protein